MRGTWDLRAVERHAEVLASTPARQIDAALELGDSGNLPAIEEAVRLLIPRNLSEIVRVRGIEDMRSVRHLHAVIVVEVERIERRAHDAERLAERVLLR